MTQSRALVFAILIALALAMWTTTPPRPLPLAAPADRFAADRAMRDVAVIGRAPHVAGSAADAAVARHLAQRLTGLGLAVRRAPVPLDGKARAKLARWSGRPVPDGLATVDVVGVLTGRDRAAPAVLLMAHHDTVWGSPGAADDSASVAAILEMVRALRTGPQPARDVIVLFIGGEELGLDGARAFFAGDPLAARVGVVLNFDTRGAGGRTLMFETGVGNGAMMRLFGRAVPWPSAASLSVTLYRSLPNSTDLTPALARGHAGFNFAFTGRAGLYHSPLATPERVDRGAVQDMGAQGLALLRALTAAPVLPPRAPDLVFSDLWGSLFVGYPAWVGWVLLGLAGLMAGAAAARVRPAGRDVWRGIGAACAIPPAAAALLFLANRLSGAGPGHDYYDRLAALPRLEVQAVLLCLAVLLPIACRDSRRDGDGGARWAGWFGLFVPIWIGGAVVQALIPTAAPLVHWPLLVAALMMTVAAWIGRARATLPLAILAGLGMGQLLGYGHLAFLAMGGPMPEVMAPVLWLIALLVRPLLHRAVAARIAWTIAGAALAGALGLALWVRLDPLAPSTAIYSIDEHRRASTHRG